MDFVRKRQASEHVVSTESNIEETNFSKKMSPRIEISKALLLEAGDREDKDTVVEGCPGCKCAQLQRSDAPFPKEIVFIIANLVLCNSLPVQILYPYLYFMVEDFNVDKQKIGTYAGLLASSFLAGRTVTALLWGVIGDKFGRKQVMFCGMLSLLVFNTLFGISESFWMALATRFLLGLFNGLHGILPAYSTEILSAKHLPFGLSLLSTMWGVGLVIGPAIGGYLSQSAWLVENTIFERYPYCLPPFVITAYGFILTVSLLRLPETLHKHTVSNQDYGSNKSIFKVHRFWISNAIYCIWTFHDIAFDETFALWAVSPEGLQWSSQDAGFVLAITGVALLVFLLIIYPRLADKFNPISIARAAAILNLPLLIAYPFLPELHGTVLYVIVTIVTILKTSLSGLTTASLFLLVNNSVGQAQKGTANGISSTLVSLARASGPAIGGVVFSWAQSRRDAAFLPGNQLLFFSLALVVVMVIAATWIISEKEQFR